MARKTQRTTKKTKKKTTTKKTKSGKKTTRTKPEPSKNKTTARRKKKTTTRLKKTPKPKPKPKKTAPPKAEKQSRTPDPTTTIMFRPSLQKLFAETTRTEPRTEPRAETQSNRRPEPEGKILRFEDYTPSEWVRVTYEGPEMYAHPQAGVFVRGISTQLRGELADQLRDTEGFRLRRAG